MKEVLDYISLQRNISYVFLIVLILFFILTAGFAYYQISILNNDVKEMTNRSTAANDLIKKTANDTESTINLINAYANAKPQKIGEQLCGLACGTAQEFPFFFSYPQECKDLFPNVVCPY